MRELLYTLGGLALCYLLLQRVSAPIQVSQLELPETPPSGVEYYGGHGFWSGDHLSPNPLPRPMNVSPEAWQQLQEKRNEQREPEPKPRSSPTTNTAPHYLSSR